MIMKPIKRKALLYLAFFLVFVLAVPSAMAESPHGICRELKPVDGPFGYREREPGKR